MCTGMLCHQYRGDDDDNDDGDTEFFNKQDHYNGWPELKIYPKGCIMLAVSILQCAHEQLRSQPADAKSC